MTSKVRGGATLCNGVKISLKCHANLKELIEVKDQKETQDATEDATQTCQEATCHTEIKSKGSLKVKSMVAGCTGW